MSGVGGAGGRSDAETFATAESTTSRTTSFRRRDCSVSERCIAASSDVDWLSTARFTAASTMSCTRSFRRSDCSVSERCISSAGASAGEPTTVSSALDTTPCTTSFRWREISLGVGEGVRAPADSDAPEAASGAGGGSTDASGCAILRAARKNLSRGRRARRSSPRTFRNNRQFRPEMDRNRRKGLAAKCVACANVGINFHASPVFIF